MTAIIDGTSASSLSGTLAVTGATTLSSTLAVTGAVTLTTALPVASGGTGAATLTANNVLLGNGTSAPLFVAPGTTGNVLTSNGTTWSSTAPAGDVTGTVANLKVVNNTATPSTKIDITADRAVPITTTGGSIFHNAVSITIDLTTGTVTSAANGMDGAARPTSNWVYLWLISNGTTIAGLGSSSSTAPTLPSGYTYKVYVGAMRCDSSQNLLRTLQKGRRSQYVVTAATNTAAMPIMGTGTAGSSTTPTWVAIAVANFAPVTATEISLALVVLAPAYAIVAPNNSYGGRGSSTNSPPLMAAASSDYTARQGVFVLESTNIYWASDSTNQLYCSGWIDAAVVA